MLFHTEIIIHFFEQQKRIQSVASKQCAELWNMKNKKQNKMKWNETRRFEWSERVWFHSIRCVWVWVCRSAFNSAKQNENKKNIFYWRSFNMQIICENEQSEREKSDIVTNVLCTDNQQLTHINLHTHTRSLILLCIPTLSPSIHPFSPTFSVFSFFSLMNTVYYSSCKLDELQRIIVRNFSLSQFCLCAPASERAQLLLYI